MTHFYVNNRQSAVLRMLLGCCDVMHTSTKLWSNTCSTHMGFMAIWVYQSSVLIAKVCTQGMAFVWNWFSRVGDLQEMPECVGKVSMAVDPSAVCTEEACCICFESPLREPTMTKCNHWFCWSVPARINMLLHAGQS